LQLRIRKLQPILLGMALTQLLLQHSHLLIQLCASTCQRLLCTRTQVHWAADVAAAVWHCRAPAAVDAAKVNGPAAAVLLGCAAAAARLAICKLPDALHQHVPL
jgi:hypothetical protein